MSRPPAVPVEDKQWIVLSVLSGEMTLAEAARRNKVSEQSLSRWKSQFLEAGRVGLAEGGKSGPSTREQQLRSEIDELTAALGEAHVQLRVWKKSAEHQLGPSRTLR
ncbi:MAG: helix-turn-helix domain-containing protein [Pseudonocardiaceae bacterium]|nr:helix-turn-helix domain-containing protein [Pseudonocardiaceae bacterium]